MRISVCMATYNGAVYIREQIDSILSQLGEEDELIISDDGSTDKTVEEVEACRDCRIVLLKRENRKRGPVFNFEYALQHAQGDLIFLSDQDDIWMPDKVEIMCQALKDYDLAFSDAFIIDREGQCVKEHFYPEIPKLGVVPNLLFNHHLGATMAFRKRVLEKALPFPPGIPMHDQWLGIIARYYFSTAFVDKQLLQYRRHGANASCCGEKSKNNLWKKIMFRFNITRALLGRIL